MALDRNAGGVAHKGDALGRVEVGDVMRSVSGSVEHLKLPRAEGKDFAAFKDLEILVRHREELTIEALHLFPVKPGSATKKLGGISHMHCAPGVDEDAQSRILLNQGSCSACVIKMNVREQNSVQIGDAEFVPPQLFAKGVNGGAGTRIQQRVEAFRSQQGCSDRARMTGPGKVKRSGWDHKETDCSASKRKKQRQTRQD